MEGNSIFKIICGEDIKVQDLKIDNSSYIVFCWNKKDYYHMIPIIDNVIYDKKGNPVRNIGDYYDAHHIIENNYGGDHAWWNIIPAKFPNEHQGGIHRSKSPIRKLFK